MSLASSDRAQSPRRGDLEDVKNRFEYSDAEYLADQTLSNDTAVFSFASPVNLVWVLCTGAEGRAVTGSGNTPSATVGARCGDGVLVPLDVSTDTVKVFVAGSATVSVYGFRF